jgi:hypothetical protein
LFHRDEVESDFLAIYGKDVCLVERPYSTGTLSGPRFFNLALQLPKYEGAVRHDALREVQEEPAGVQVGTTAVLMLDPDVQVG